MLEGSKRHCGVSITSRKSAAWPEPILEQHRRECSLRQRSHLIASDWALQNRVSGPPPNTSGHVEINVTAG